MDGGRSIIMKKLIDYTKILRSKNAGPLFITFDLMFDSREKMDYVMNNLKPCMIAKAYDVLESDISIIKYEVVNSIKITFPRKNVSGSFLDDDIYGCQQHVPLSNIEV
ncbi:MAG: DUF4387 domain-containing protein [Clostridiales bacterium]|nr:DUF4387 domain-containing protein [Clostridiales bacterium]